MYRKITLFVLLVNAIASIAQEFEPVGSKALGMANASVTISDEWAAFHNVAGIVNEKEGTLALFYKTNFGIQALNETAFSSTKKLKSGAFAASFYRFGTETYALNRIGLGYAHKIEKVQLGIQFNYNQVRILDLDTKAALTLEIGGIVELIPNTLFFGASALNITQSRRKEERLPVLLKAGLSYRMDKKIMLNADLEKDIRYTPMVKVGLEYAIIRNVFIRTGFTTRPFLNYAGIGFFTKRFQVDYALSTHNRLGFSHSCSLLLYFNRKK
jgi:hypothetical protein